LNGLDQIESPASCTDGGLVTELSLYGNYVAHGFSLVNGLGRKKKEADPERPASLNGDAEVEEF
jgi:hypothetical protein